MCEVQAVTTVGGADEVPLRVVAEEVQEGGAQTEAVGAEGDAVAGVADVVAHRLDEPGVAGRDLQPLDPDDGVHAHTAHHEQVELH